MASLSHCQKVKTQIYIIIFFFAFLILFPVSLALCVPIYIFRFIVAMARKVFRPDLGKMITTRSAVIATDNPSKNPNWNLCVWLTLEGNLDFEKFRDNFLNNIVLKTNVGGELANPEYQQYFSQWLGFLFWKWEDNFNIEEHMKYFFGECENSTKKLTTENELRGIIKALTAKPFGAEKSPWEFLFIPNYLEIGESYPQKSVLMFRVHHGFCDGYTILWLLMKEVNKVNMDKVAQPSRPQKNLIKRFLDSLLFWIRAPYDFMELMVKSKDSNEWHLPQEKLERPFNTGFTPRIPLKYIKDIKNANSVSFTSVVMASLTGGLRNMMIERGVKVPQRFTTAIAVPMPGHPEKLRNHFIFSFMSLPVGVGDPKKRLSKIEKEFQSLKRSPVTLFSFAMIPIFGGLFTKMIDWFSSNEFSTVLTSNFPGPPETSYFVGGGGSNRVLDMNFSAGMGVGNVGVGFCMLSYDNGMRIITSVDKSILPTDSDVDELNEKIQEEFEILKTALDSSLAIQTLV